MNNLWNHFVFIGEMCGRPDENQIVSKPIQLFMNPLSLSQIPPCGRNDIL